MTNLEILAEILGDLLGVTESEVTLESTMEAMGGDSLDDVEFIMALEEEYDIEIPDDDAEELKTVGDVLNLLERYEAVSKKNG